MKRMGLWIALAVFMAMGVTFAMYLRANHWQVDVSQSVLQYGGPRKAGVFYISEFPSPLTLVPALPAEVIDGVEKSQVLVYKDARRKLLIFGSHLEGRGQLNALDLASGQASALAWQSSLGEARLTSTPVILPDRQMLWALTSDLQELTKGRYLPKLMAFDLGGERRCELPVDLGERASRLHCITALGFESKTKSLVFGCSAREITDLAPYHSERGKTGVLAIVRLPLAGCPKAADVELWSPSQVDAKDPRSGFDTGIWMSGAAPLTSGNGQVLFSTGNGLFAPAVGNYGCAIMNLDLQSRPLKATVVWAHDQSLPGLTTDECSAMNIDSSSSGLSLIEDRNQGASEFLALGKDSILKWGKLQGAEPVTTWPVAAFLNYGQPAVLAQDGDRREAWVATKFASNAAFMDENYVPTDAQSCELVLLKSKIGDALEVVNFHSGSYRKDQTIAVQGSEAAAQLQSRTSVFADSRVSYRHTETTFPPYVAQKVLGYVPAKMNVGFRQVSLRIEKGENLFDLRPVVTGQSGVVLAKPSVDAGKMWQAVSPTSCEALSASDYVFLKKDKVLTYGASRLQNRLDTYALKKGMTPHRRMRWQEDNPDWTLTRTSPAVGISPTGRKIALVTLESKSGEQSRLVVIDPDRGQTLTEVILQGTPHFSMPVIFEDQIFVTTRKPNRLYAFRITKADAKIQR